MDSLLGALERLHVDDDLADAEEWYFGVKPNTTGVPLVPRSMRGQIKVVPSARNLPYMRLFEPNAAMLKSDAGKDELYMVAHLSLQGVYGNILDMDERGYTMNLLLRADELYRMQLSLVNQVFTPQLSRIVPGTELLNDPREWVSSLGNKLRNIQRGITLKTLKDFVSPFQGDNTRWTSSFVINANVSGQYADHGVYLSNPYESTTARARDSFIVYELPEIKLGGEGLRVHKVFNDMMSRGVLGGALFIRHSLRGSGGTYRMYYMGIFAIHSVWYTTDRFNRTRTFFALVPAPFEAGLRGIVPGVLGAAPNELRVEVYTKRNSTIEKYMMRKFGCKPYLE